MAQTTSRFLNSRGGSVPLSPFQIWMPIKMIIMAANPTNSPMMTELFHGCSVPPHCSASSKQMMDGTSMAVPSRSRLSTLCSTVLPPLSRWSPMCRNTKMATMAAPPIGRLM